MNNSKHSALPIPIDAIFDACRLAVAVALILIITTAISLTPVLPLITIS